MKRVLAINAPAGLLQLLRDALVRDDCEVHEARSGLQALHALRARSYEVVLTDPVTDFDEDLALVREADRLRPGVRLIVLAPSATVRTVVDALRAHVFACFTSPYDLQEIVDMTRQALDADAGTGIELVSGLPYWVTLRVSCRVTTADRLVRFMTELRSDLQANDRFLLLTALRELVLNAMEHGAGFDPDKVLEVTAARTSRAIVFHVRDPGDGFDRAALEHASRTNDPAEILRATEERAGTGLRPGGFGMLIARQIADELVYNERGNEVLLVKYVDKEVRSTE